MSSSFLSFLFTLILNGLLIFLFFFSFFFVCGHEGFCVILYTCVREKVCVCYLFLFFFCLQFDASFLDIKILNEKNETARMVEIKKQKVENRNDADSLTERK